jgi:molybdopterin-guanine dinucleotide biosynthesis protein A
MIMGAVLAGGASRRFGSDKALAPLNDRPLIDHVIAAMVPQCDALVVVGRCHDDWASLTDRPEGNEGPLAGLNAALHHAAASGYVSVLSAPCDMPELPTDLLRLLGAGPATLADHPVVGLWPVSLAPVLDHWFVTGQRSVRGFAAHAGARMVSGPVLRNINFPADL